MYFINPYNLILDVRKISHDGKKQIDPQKMIDIIKTQTIWETIPITSSNIRKSVIIAVKDDNNKE